MINAVSGGMPMSTEMTAQMRERMFARLDGDSDGQIDLAALQEQVEAGGDDSVRLSRLLEDLQAADADGDGMVSKAEFETVKPPPPPRPPMAAESSTMEQSEATLLDFLYAEDGSRIDSEQLTGELLNLFA